MHIEENADELETAIEGEKIEQKPADQEEDISMADQAEKEPAKAQEDEQVEGDGDSEDVNDEGEVSAPETVEWEADDGTKYELPANIVPSLMKNKDYTQKTQAVAAEKQALEQAKQEWEAEKQRDEEDLRLDAEIHRLSDLDGQYAKLDWDRLAEEDMDLARRRQFEHDRVRAQLADIKGQKEQRTAERSQKHQETILRRIEEAEQYAAANIPNWGAQKSKEIWDYALADLGYDEATLRNNLDGKLMKAIHKAYIGDAALKRAQKPGKKPAQATQPLKKVEAKSGPTTRRNLASADYETYQEMIKSGEDPTLGSLR